MRPPLKFSSWIGGDRDGNPFVTVDVTRQALPENRKAAVERLDKRLTELAQLISLSVNEVTVPEDFTPRAGRAARSLRAEARASPQRNPQEPFRQFFSALRVRLDGNFGQARTPPFADTAEFDRRTCSPRSRRSST